jgi:8-oxo-dGTP pyrophosphatase MutT (NUDIX family)
VSWTRREVSAAREGAPPVVQRRFPVSIKGVVVQHDRVLLLRNEREEWELPGGRIELGETPEACVAREISEETGWQVDVGQILDTWMYHVGPGEGHVFIATYGCHLAEPTGSAAAPVLSREHKEIGLFAAADVDNLAMPTGYKRSIAAWYSQLADGGRS